MKKNIFWPCLMLAFLLNLPAAHAAEKIRIVATMGTLGAFSKQIVGADADIHVVAKPGRDIHFVQPTPKDVLKVKKADVFVHGGLDLEVWRAPLLNAAGNARFFTQNGAAIDASQGIALLEVPVDPSRLQGDIHVFGNPHYWTDPVNAKQMVKNLSTGFVRLYPERSAEFERNTAQLLEQLDAAIERWTRELAPYQGTAFVSYHKSWPYFAKRFGFDIVGYIEPKPGIPPTGRHLKELAELMKERQARFVVKETYQERRAAEKVARDADVPLITLMQFAGEDKISGYVEMMDENIRRVIEAIEKSSNGRD